MPTYSLSSNHFFQSDYIQSSPPSDPEATITMGPLQTASNNLTYLAIDPNYYPNNGVDSPFYQIPTITTTIPYSYPYYPYPGGMGQITPFYPAVSYTIYKVKYLLVPAGAAKELVFTCKTDTAPEVAILQAADLQKLSYILILGIHELSTSDVMQDPNHPIQEIVL